MTRCEEIISELLRIDIGDNSNLTKRGLDFHLKYIASGVIAIYMDWLRYDRDLDLYELAEIARHILVSNINIIYNVETKESQIKCSFCEHPYIIVRAAIDGGMSWMVATGIYHHYTQKAQQAKSIYMLIELYHQMFCDFANHVAHSKEDYQFSPLVRQCRLYISEHLYEPAFSL